MKAIKNLVMMSALAAAACLASCNNDDEVNVNNGQVHFAAAIGSQALATPQSRASGTAWAAGDHIGIFMVNHGTTTIAEAAANKDYTTATGTTTFTPVTGHEIYYPMDGSAVDFIAYYPHTAGATLTTPLPVTIGTPQTTASQADFDLLWAKAANTAAAGTTGTGYTKESAGAVELKFGHCLSKLTMNCKLDASVGVSTLDDAIVTITGMNTLGTFDLKTSTLSATPNTSEDITPNKLPAPTDAVKYAATYNAIILPCTYPAATVTVQFVIATETFTWDVGAMTFEAGKEYIYEVTITRTGIQVQGTIVNWDPVDKGGVTAE